MMYLNLAGHVGKDPEVRFTTTGQKLTTFSIAVKSKKSKEETTWWKVVIWGDQFEKMIPFIKKGSTLMIMGSMSPPQIYRDKMGEPKISLTITPSEILFSPFGSNKSETPTVTEVTIPQKKYEPQDMFQSPTSTPFSFEEVPF